MVGCLLESETNMKLSLLTLTMTIFVSSGVLLFIKAHINEILLEDLEN